MPFPFFSQQVICEDTNMPEVDFDHCDPTTLLSEIEKVALGNPQGADFTDITDEAELITRLSQSDMGDNAVRLLTVVGEKPASTPVVINISNGRKRTPAEDNTLTVTIDDISDKIWAYAKYLKQHPYQKLYYWIIQAGKMFYYGNKGIIVEISVVDTFATGREGILTLVLTMTWRNAPTLPDMADYPLSGAAAPALIVPTGSALTKKTATSYRATIVPVTGATSYDLEKIINGAAAVVQNTVTPSVDITGLPLDATLAVRWRAKDATTTTAYSTTVTGNTFDTSLGFAGATSANNSTGGVEATVTANNATKKFDFDTIANATGSGNTMAIMISAVQQVSVTFPAPYVGQPFAYIHSDGTKYFGVFANGNVTPTV